MNRECGLMTANIGGMGEKGEPIAWVLISAI